MTEMPTRIIRCDVCGERRPHFALHGKLELDADGRAFERVECATCGAHAKVYEHQDDQSQADEQTQ